MDQKKIGRFIGQKRKEMNLTQAELAEQLGITNKSVSKWETGKSMPDYALVEPLCKTLNISVSELLDDESEDAADNGGMPQDYSEKVILQAIRQVQILQKEKRIMTGVIFLAMGIDIAALDVSRRICSTAGDGIISTCIMGVATILMMAGLFISVRSFRK